MILPSYVNDYNVEQRRQTLINYKRDFEKTSKPHLCNVLNVLGNMIGLKPTMNILLEKDQLIDKYDDNTLAKELEMLIEKGCPFDVNVWYQLLCWAEPKPIIIRTRAQSDIPRSRANVGGDVTEQQAYYQKLVDRANKEVKKFDKLLRLIQEDAELNEDIINRRVYNDSPLRKFMDIIHRKDKMRAQDKVSVLLNYAINIYPPIKRVFEIVSAYLQQQKVKIGQNIYEVTGISNQGKLDELDQIFKKHDEIYKNHMNSISNKTDDSIFTPLPDSFFQNLESILFNESDTCFAVMLKRRPEIYDKINSWNKKAYNYKEVHGCYNKYLEEMKEMFHQDTLDPLYHLLKQAILFADNYQNTAKEFRREYPNVLMNFFLGLYYKPYTDPTNDHLTLIKAMKSNNKKLINDQLKLELKKLNDKKGNDSTISSLGTFIAYETYNSYLYKRSERRQLRNVYNLYPFNYGLHFYHGINTKKKIQSNAFLSIVKSALYGLKVYNLDRLILYAGSTNDDIYNQLLNYENNRLKKPEPYMDFLDKPVDNLDDMHIKLTCRMIIQYAYHPSLYSYIIMECFKKMGRGDIYNTLMQHFQSEEFVFFCENNKTKNSKFAIMPLTNTMSEDEKYDRIERNFVYMEKNKSKYLILLKEFGQLIAEGLYKLRGDQNACITLYKLYGQQTSSYRDVQDINNEARGIRTVVELEDSDENKDESENEDEESENEDEENESSDQEKESSDATAESNDEDESELRMGFPIKNEDELRMGHPIKRSRIKGDVAEQLNRLTIDTTPNIISTAEEFATPLGSATAAITIKDIYRNELKVCQKLKALYNVKENGTFRTIMEYSMFSVYNNFYEILLEKKCNLPLLKQCYEENDYVVDAIMTYFKYIDLSLVDDDFLQYTNCWINSIYFSTDIYQTLNVYTAQRPLVMTEIFLRLPVEDYLNKRGNANAIQLLKIHRQDADAVACRDTLFFIIMELQRNKNSKDTDEILAKIALSSILSKYLKNTDDPLEPVKFALNEEAKTVRVQYYVTPKKRFNATPWQHHLTIGADVADNPRPPAPPTRPAFEPFPAVIPLDKSKFNIIIFSIQQYLYYEFSNNKSKQDIVPKFMIALLMLDTSKKILENDTTYRLYEFSMGLLWNAKSQVVTLILLTALDGHKMSILRENKKYEPNKDLIDAKFCYTLFQSLKNHIYYPEILNNFTIDEGQIILAPVILHMINRLCDAEIPDVCKIDYNVMLTQISRDAQTLVFEQWKDDDILRTIEQVVTNRNVATQTLHHIIVMQLLGGRQNLYYSKELNKIFGQYLAIPGHKRTPMAQIIANYVACLYKQHYYFEPTMKIENLLRDINTVNEPYTKLLDINKTGNAKQNTPYILYHNLMGNYYISPIDINKINERINIGAEIDEIDEDEDDNDLHNKDEPDEDEEDDKQLDAIFENEEWIKLINLATPKWFKKHVYDSDAIFPPQYKSILQKKLGIFDNKMEIGLNANDVANLIKQELVMGRIGMALCHYYEYDNLKALKPELDAQLRGQYVPVAFIDELNKQSTDPWACVAVPQKYNNLLSSKILSRRINLLVRLKRENEIQYMVDDVTLPMQERLLCKDKIKIQANVDDSKIIQYLKNQLTLHPDNSQLLDLYLYAQDFPSNLPFTLNDLIANEKIDLPLKPVNQVVADFQKLSPIVQEAIAPLLEAIKVAPTSYLIRQIYNNALQESDENFSVGHLMEYQERQARLDVQNLQEFMQTSITQMQNLILQCKDNPSLVQTYTIAKQTLIAINDVLKRRIDQRLITIDFLENKIFPTLIKFELSCSKLGVQLPKELLKRRHTIGLEMGDAVENEMENLCRYVSKVTLSEKARIGVENVNDLYLDDNVRKMQLKHLKDDKKLDGNTKQFITTLMDINNHLLKQHVNNMDEIVNKIDDADQQLRLQQMAIMLHSQKKYNELFNLLAKHWQNTALWEQTVPELLAKDEYEGNTVPYLELQKLLEIKRK